MSAKKNEQLLKAANNRLKSGSCGFKIEQRGQKLTLRGTLPPRPGSDKEGPCQQRLSLGVYANPAGIKRAENEAKRLSSEIALNQFDWKNWLETKEPLGTTDYWIARYEEDYFRKKAATPESLTTWKTEYLTMFKRLPQGVELNKEALSNLVFSTDADTRTRRRAVMVANAIAKFAGLNINFNEYKGNYTNKNSERILPTDEAIAQMYHSIPNPAWQYVFGLMAAYGLSNHEVFLVDLESLQREPGHLISTYRKGHYGLRRIWCLYPEWWQEWELNKPRELPKVTGKDNRALGHRVTKSFKRYDLCKPYDLRHCWAIRAMSFMPNPMAARMMAHTESEHNKTYQRWISEAQEDQFYKILMERGDRPQPPRV
ncbi:hypothetical protein Xen7305DRAFT_00008030 [Xenococcus sp. PCC 7305]|uniref:hypothetical protein n=1 Tax=Xenococcus sp. PCC 7305 TaxID=102125 RepID=UPI0002AC4B28|nr:hypothetical protein [Xenococcus sp. PCC 7305]ELS01101.1 hypothetical protein Xen7305DRAFT_00008030 [Xenococcus sp. PCC 7305]